MARHFMTLVALLMLQSPAFAQGTAESGGDVCALRPDLCESGPARAPARRAAAQPSFKTTPPARPATAQAQPAGTSISVQATRPAAQPAARAVAQPANTNCRMPGASYDLDTASLPLCKNVGTSIRGKPVYNTEVDNVWQDIHDGHAKPLPDPPRGPSSIGNGRPVKLNFESYMNANASNPAISGRRALPQEAFKDWSKPAVITGSSSDLDNKNPDGTTSGTPSTNGAAIAPGGVAPAGGTPPAITPGAAAPVQDAYPSSSSSSGSAPAPNNR